jgi:alkylation response protein AidB-like acyl-CoA dehydrogenase
MITGTHRVGFGLTEPNHGSDATWLETTARRTAATGSSREEAVQLRPAQRQLGHDLRAHEREAGDARGITCFLVPTDAPGFRVEFMWWTFNMPSDHAEVSLERVRVPASAVLGEVGGGLALANTFTHENRIRQAASSLGAAQYCVDESVAYAR